MISGQNHRSNASEKLPSLAENIQASNEEMTCDVCWVSSMVCVQSRTMSEILWASLRVLLSSDKTISLWQALQWAVDLPRQQWSLLNRFRTEQGHCGACRRKWRLTDTDLCPCGETQTMSHIVESCPLTKLNGGLSRLHSADEDAVSWLTNNGKWHAYEKKKKWAVLFMCSWVPTTVVRKPSFLHLKDGKGFRE